MKKIDAKSGGLKGKVRDRMRSIRKRVVAIALSTRLMGPQGDWTTVLFAVGCAAIVLSGMPQSKKTTEQVIREGSELNINADKALQFFTPEHT
jgi:two-component sensor histidine kinase